MPSVISDNHLEAAENIEVAAAIRISTATTIEGSMANALDLSGWQ
jgi:hypothetical protein